MTTTSATLEDDKCFPARLGGRKRLIGVSGRLGGRARARVLLLLAGVLGLSGADLGAVGSMASIQRHVYKPLETCGELLDSYENDPPPQKADLNRLSRTERERGRRSGGRK